MWFLAELTPALCSGDVTYSIMRMDTSSLWPSLTRLSELFSLLG